MKSFKRILALLLALMMIFALCACDSDKGKDKDDDGDDVKVENKKDNDKKTDDDKKTDAELIVGTWEGEIDFSEFLDEYMNDSDMDESMLMLLAYFDFSSIDYIMTVEFEENGDYALGFSADEAQVKKMFRDGMRDMLNDMLIGSGMTLADLAAQESMTEDEYLDALVDQSLDVDEMFADANESGTYDIKDGKIYFTADGDEKDADNYTEYKLKGDKLTFVASYDGGEPVEESVYPINFDRK